MSAEAELLVVAEVAEATVAVSAVLCCQEVQVLGIATAPECHLVPVVSLQADFEVHLVSKWKGFGFVVAAKGSSFEQEVALVQHRSTKQGEQAEWEALQQQFCWSFQPIIQLYLRACWQC